MEIKTHLFRVGDRVHCILYGGKNGIVFRIDGTQRPDTCQDLGIVVTGGSAQFHVVFRDHISVVPECIVRGVQWRLLEGFADTDEIALALDRVAAAQAKAKRGAAEKAERKAIECASLPSRYPYLTPSVGSGKRSHAVGAKNIRTELKRVFPGVRFFVRSRSFAGGNSIDVSWTDGPTAEQVRGVIDKYSQGRFDGMTDLYEYDDSHVWTEVFGGAKYVHAQREHSAELRRRAAEDLGLEYQERYTDFCDQERVWRSAREMSLCEPKAEVPSERDLSSIPLPDEFTKPVQSEEEEFVRAFAQGSPKRENER